MSGIDKVGLLFIVIWRHWSGDAQMGRGNRRVGQLSSVPLCDRRWAYLMEVLTTPLRSVFTPIAVKDGKKTLPMDLVEWSDESMRIFHKSPWTLGMSDCTRILGVLGPM